MLRITNCVYLFFVRFDIVSVEIVATCILQFTRMLAINVSIPNLKITRLVQL